MEIKKMLGKIGACLLVAATIGTSLNVNASVTSVTKLHLLQGQVITARAATRTGKYSYIRVRCDSVYPDTGGKDTYTKMQVGVKGVTGSPTMSGYTTIKEGNDFYNISLYDGTLDNYTIAIYFRGNDPDKSAYADVSYDPM